MPEMELLPQLKVRNWRSCIKKLSSLTRKKKKKANSLNHEYIILILNEMNSMDCMDAIFPCLSP